MGNQIEKAINALDPEALDAAISELEKNIPIEDNASVSDNGQEAANVDVSGESAIEAMQKTIDDLTAKLEKQNEQMGRMVTLLGARISPKREDVTPTSVDESANLPAMREVDAHENVPDLDSLTVEFH